MTGAVSEVEGGGACDYVEAVGAHDAEPLYSTFLSRALRLRDLNRVIHSIPSLHPLLEFVVFLCGYAFNPVCVPAWTAAAHFAGSSSSAFSLSHHHPAPGVGTGGDAIVAENHSRAPHPNSTFAPAFYLATMGITLAATEACKASFAATRPEGILSRKFRSSRIRRYGKLVTSLKSRHSFPSGDCAQAANACLFLWTYVPPLGSASASMSVARAATYTSWDWIVRGVALAAFLPGVCFARVFYHCHWVEDCAGGVALSALLHATIIPAIGRILGDVMREDA